MGACFTEGNMPVVSRFVGIVIAMYRDDAVGRQIEVHALEAGAFRLAQTARGGDTVRPVLLPGLGFDADELFTPL